MRSKIVNFFHEMVNRHPLLGEAALPTLSGMLVLTASFVTFLGNYRYPLFTPEVVTSVLLLVAFSAVAGLLYAAAEKVGRILLQCLLVLLAFDLNFEGAVVVIGAVAFLILFNRHTMKALIIISSVILLFIPFGLIVNNSIDDYDLKINISDNRSNNPPLIHIILDEHIGTEGLINDDAPSLNLQRDIIKFYLENGFKLYGGAYSEYKMSINSIPHILNFGRYQKRPEGGRRKFIIDNNKYFDNLVNIGYKNVNIYQSGYINFCKHVLVNICDTRKYSNINSLHETEIDKIIVAYILLKNYVNLSKIFRGLIAVLNNVIIKGLKSYGFNVNTIKLHHDIPPLDDLSALDLVSRAVRVARPGSVIFVHVLVPHDPFVAAPDCNLRDYREWQYREHGKIVKRRAGYADQVYCVLTKLGSVFDSAADDAIIIVHGDHGSRITKTSVRTENEGIFSEFETVATYSTLFAIRGPGIKSQYVADSLPVARLLERAAKTNFQDMELKLPGEFEHTVVLEDKNWNPIKRYPLPEWWINR